VTLCRSYYPLTLSQTEYNLRYLRYLLKVFIIYLKNINTLSTRKVHMKYNHKMKRKDGGTSWRFVPPDDAVMVLCLLLHSEMDVQLGMRYQS